jgi:hypothetical protein
MDITSFLKSYKQNTQNLTEDKHDILDGYMSTNKVNINDTYYHYSFNDNLKLQDNRYFSVSTEIFKDKNGNLIKYRGRQYLYSVKFSEGTLGIDIPHDHNIEVNEYEVLIQKNSVCKLLLIKKFL